MALGRKLLSPVAAEKNRFAKGLWPWQKLIFESSTMPHIFWGHSRSRPPLARHCHDTSRSHAFRDCESHAATVLSGKGVLFTWEGVGWQCHRLRAGPVLRLLLLLLAHGSILLLEELLLLRCQLSPPQRLELLHLRWVVLRANTDRHAHPWPHACWDCEGDGLAIRPTESVLLTRISICWQCHGDLLWLRLLLLLRVHPSNNWCGTDAEVHTLLSMKPN